MSANLINKHYNDNGLNNGVCTPFSFGMSFYFKTAPQNLSWVKSVGQWNLKTGYPDLFGWLLAILNGDLTVDGVTVKDSNAEDITPYDWVINREAETFRFPLLNGSEDLPDYSSRTQQTINTTYYNDTNAYIYVQAPYNNGGTPTLSVSQNADMSDSRVVWYHTMAISSATTDGNIAFIPKGYYYEFKAAVNAVSKIYRFPCKGNGDLYFYVGDVVKNATEINVAQLQQEVTNLQGDKVDKSDLARIIAPDFTQIVQLPTTLNLVQQMDKDGYLIGLGNAGTDLNIAVCDADGSIIMQLQANDSDGSSAISSCSPLLLKGTYFKVTRSGGILHKIYAGGNNV